MNTAVRSVQVGQRRIEADFRSVIGNRSDSVGSFRRYTSPLGASFDVVTASGEDLQCAVRAARNGFLDWRLMAPQARRSAMMSFADAIDAAAAELGALDCLDMGKPINAAENEAHIAAFIVRWYAEAIDKVFGSVVPSHPGSIVFSESVPYGVVAAIVSWNYPVINAAMKIAPALAAGNAVVLKPSENAVLSALRLGDLAQSAGLPKGLLCVLNGDGSLGAALCRHPDVNMIAFTGSTPTGEKVAALAGARLAPSIVECGGKNPILVAEDFSDVDAVVRDVMSASFANTGQLCVARSKIIVPRRLRASFVEALYARLPEVRSGNPVETTTAYGPLAYAQHAKSVFVGVARALSEGSRLLLDGRAAGESELHCAATLLEAEAPDVYSMVHEFFGPVLTLYAYDHMDEALAAANAGGWGLSATAWTYDLRRARSLTTKLHAGQIVIRATPGIDAGVQMSLPVEPAGRSGYGVEFGTQALRSFSRLQAVQYVGLVS